MSVSSGSLRGDFNVTSDGAASYSVPLAVPPGTAGMAPSLALAYHSAAKNDLVGVGFRLHGMSAITRVGAIPATDGYRGAVNHDARDRFSIDGQRLVCIEGTYGSAGAVYHTEQETWRKVVTKHGNRVGPDSFVVYEKDGRVLEYGATADSRVVIGDASSTVRTWALNKVTDRNGNYMTFQYLQKEGAYYPARIDYTGNGTIAPRRSVRFEYEARPDVSTRYAGGYSTRTSQRLARVDTFVDQRLGTSYKLEYLPPGATGRSRLRSVTQLDAAGNSLPPTRFDWQDGDTRLFASRATVTPTELTYGGSFLPVDVNGDGRLDFLNATNAHGALTLDVFAAAGREGGFRNPVRVPSTTPALPFGGQLYPVDVNGDGRTDLVYAVRSGTELRLTVFMSSPDAAGNWRLKAGTPSTGAAPLPAGGDLYPADVDGDGATDFIYVTRAPEGTQFRLLTSNGTTYDAGAVLTTSLPYGGTCIPIDVDGDGMTDLVYAYSAQGTLQLASLKSHGKTLSLAGTKLLPAELKLAYTGSLLPMDINGDGLVDLVHAGRAKDGTLVLTSLISTGAGFAPQPSQAFPDIPFNSVLLPAELNGDGMTDLAISTRTPDGPSLRTLISTGTGFRAADAGQPLKSLPWGSLLPLDLNGVGRSGLLNLGQVGDKLSLGSLLPAGEAPDLLTRITNGSGGTFSVRYQPITDSTVYRQSRQGLMLTGMTHGAATGATFTPNANGILNGTPAATAPAMTGAFPHYVVASYSKGDGRGNAYDYRYSYGDAAVDVAGGRTWLGFASQTAVDVQAGTTTTTDIRQEFPFTGMVASSRVMRTSDAALMFKSAMTYEANNPHPGVHQVLNTATATDQFSFGHLDGTIRSATKYDAFGNATLQSDLGDGSSVPMFTRKTYLNDTARWRIGLNTSVIVTGDVEGTNVVSKEETQFDGERMNAIVRRTWHDQGSKWLETKGTYDSFGNLTAEIDPAGAVRTIGYDSEFHTFAAAETLPPNADGKSWTTRTTTDPVFGQALSVIDQNGVETAQRIDGFGRVVATLGPNAAGAMIELALREFGTDAVGTYHETRERLDWEGQQWQRRREYRDGHGRVIRALSPTADGVTMASVDKTYNSKDLVSSETLPYLPGVAPQVITYVYDEYGRTIRSQRPADGGGTRVDRVEYPTVNTLVKVDGAGTPLERRTRTTQAVVNGKNLPTSTTDATGGTTTIGYDALGRIVRTEDAKGSVTTVAYDSLGNQTQKKTTTKNGVTIRSDAGKYDVITRTVTKTDARGRSSVTTLDALGRNLRYVDDKGATTTYAYDDGATRSIGRLQAVKLPDGSGYSFAYDAYGNQTAITVSVGGEQHVITRSFLPSKRPEQIVYPDGAAHRMKYLPGGPLASIMAGDVANGMSVVMGDYDANGKPGSLAYGNGVTERLRYNSGGQLSSHEVADAKHTPLHSTRFRWNVLDDLAAIDDVVTPARGYQFTYDGAGRLAQADGPYAEPQKYEYDLAGNLSKKAGVAMQYKDGLVVSAGALSLQYDANGNTTGVRGRSESGTPAPDLALEYDAIGHLVAGGGCTFTYDHQGRRFSKRVAGGATTYYVAPDYEVTIRADGARQHTRYLRGPFGLAASVTVVDSGAATAASEPGIPAAGVCYFHRNQINSTTLVTNGAGAVLATVEYLPFGEISAFTGADVFRAKFTGRELDRETGLYDFGARYYMPAIGRFITADEGLGGPIERHDSLNAYAYVLNSPVATIDPTGLGISDWLPYVLDAALIIAGVVVLATAPFTGGVTAALGGMLLGAGISGLVYDVTLAIKGERDQFSWGHWGVQVGIGAAVGAISGGAMHGASSFASSVAGSTSSFSSSFAVGAGGRIAFMAAVGAIDGAATAAFSTWLTNLDNGRPPEHGVGWSALVGGIAGGLGSGLGAATHRVPGVTKRFSYADNVTDFTGSLLGGVEAVKSPIVTTFGMALLKVPGPAMKITGALTKYGLQWSW